MSPSQGAEPLAFLFDVLGLDCRLRHHRRALTVAEKAEVLRSMAGELQRGISEAKAPWCGALLREMTCCLLEMCPGEGMERMEGMEGIEGGVEGFFSCASLGWGSN